MPYSKDAKTQYPNSTPVISHVTKYVPLLNCWNKYPFTMSMKVYLT